MNCGCVTRGNPFDMNEQIMEPCVLHLVWLDIKTKEIKLQNSELDKARHEEELKCARLAGERDNLLRLNRELRKWISLYSECDCDVSENRGTVHWFACRWVLGQKVLGQAPEQTKHHENCDVNDDQIKGKPCNCAVFAEKR